MLVVVMVVKILLIPGQCPIGGEWGRGDGRDGVEDGGGETGEEMRVVGSHSVMTLSEALC